MIKIIYSVHILLRKMLFGSYLLGIILVTLLPPSSLPSIPLFYGADKLIHFILYAGLSWLTFWAFNFDSKLNQVVKSLIILILFGSTMELVQILMRVGRTFSIGDIIANIAGVGIGMSLYLVLLKKYKKTEL